MSEIKKQSTESTPIEDILIPKAAILEQVVVPERLEVPKDSEGMFLHFKGGKYPMKGYPNQSAVTSAAMVKKLIVYTFDIIANSFWLLVPFLLFKRKKVGKLFIRWIDKTELAKHFLVPNRYCQSGREMYRAMEKVFAKKNIHDQEAYYRLRRVVHLICIIWEVDNAYRYRLQDVLSSMNQVGMNLNPKKEIMRLLDCLIEREQQLELVPKYLRVKKALSFMLMSPSFRNIARDIFCELDLEKVGFDDADKYYAYPLFGFNYGGKTKKEYMVEWKEICERSPLNNEK